MDPLTLAYLCDKIYENSPGLIIREEVEVNVFYGEMGDAVIFRGTDRLDDWGQTLNVFTGEYYDVLVHKGFRNSIKKVLSQLPSADAKPKYIAGHSKGGSLAILYAYHLWNMGWRDFECYTFGSPKVFSTQPSKSFFNRCHQFQYNNDPVPFLPPHYPDVSLIYLHRFRKCLPIWLDKLLGFFDHKFDLDHSMECYITALKEYNKNVKSHQRSDPQNQGETQPPS